MFMNDAFSSIFKIVLWPAFQIKYQSHMYMSVKDLMSKVHFIQVHISVSLAMCVGHVSIVQNLYTPESIWRTAMYRCTDFLFNRMILLFCFTISYRQTIMPGLSMIFFQVYQLGTIFSIFVHSSVSIFYCVNYHDQHTWRQSALSPVYYSRDKTSKTTKKLKNLHINNGRKLHNYQKKIWQLKKIC